MVGLIILWVKLMNLKDLISDKGLQKDEWSQQVSLLGKDTQLEVVGHDNGKGSNKFYILKCHECSKDPDLFGEGYFKCLKSNLLKGSVPCGCGSHPLWTVAQYTILCSRKASELGYTFLGFEGKWLNQKTNTRMLCDKHGEWVSGIVATLVNVGRGCPACQLTTISKVNTKPDDVMIQSFFDSGAFHPDTKFWRSDRLNNMGHKIYWHVFCPECGGQGESQSSGLQQGRRSCFCNVQRQQQAYVNLVMDDTNVVAIKFGIARNSVKRAKQQNTKSLYKIIQHSFHEFPDTASTKKAERECKQELECGVLSKYDMPDGHTETTWAYNLEKIIEIYERNGGILQENG